MQSQLSETPHQTLITEVKRPVCHRAKLIGIDLASGPDETVFTNLNSAKHFADKATALLNKSEDMTICNAVTSITNLAILNRSVLHINVAYTPEDEGLVVKVFKADTNYMDRARAIFRRGLYLDQPSSLLQLQTVEDDLIELIGSAKDKLMGAV